MGQFLDCLFEELADFVPGAQKQEGGDDGAADGEAWVDVVHEGGHFLPQPGALGQHYGCCVEEDGCFVEDVFQRHEAYSAAYGQPPAVKVAALEGDACGSGGGGVSEYGEEGEREGVGVAEGGEAALDDAVKYGGV